MGKDMHAVSGRAQRTALEVLAANNVVTIIQRDDGFTPTPVISRAILVYNWNRKEHFADGITACGDNLPEGRAANQPLSVTTLRPPIGARLPGAAAPAFREQEVHG